MNEQDKTALKERIKSLGEQIAAMQVERQQLRQQFAESQTTLKVGDRVTHEGAKYVWELTKIMPRNWGDKPSFLGKQIKKDGTPGMYEREIYSGSHELTIAESKDGKS